METLGEIKGPIPYLVAVRDFKTEVERGLMDSKMQLGWPHIRPNSVLVYAMGHHWAPGSWEKVADMVMWTNQRGVYCAFQEGQDRCLDWGDALGLMRNEASLMAMNEGFDWLLYIDNDVLPEPDILWRLLSWDFPIVVPYVVEPGTGTPVHGPKHIPNTGLHPAKWSVLSLMLWSTRVFRCWDPGTFWHDPQGADEGFHMQKLWSKGHRIYMDTNTQLVVSNRPTYPLAVNKPLEGESFEDYWQRRIKFFAEKVFKHARPPDRRPITPGKPVTAGGEYIPFGMKAEQRPDGSLRIDPALFSPGLEAELAVPDAMSNNGQGGR